jgi:serine phosphatase RsbU (regulator of sigma subunit)/anti-sigma regulatory factor (Ser/Thr protein kinase)/putative methionine-R-sulfoxide reductase with GAF domain
VVKGERAARRRGSGVAEAAAREAARVQVELATAAADAMPLAELEPAAGDLTRVLPLLQQVASAVAGLLSTDLAVVWTTEPQADVLVASAWVGLADDYIRPMRVPFGAASAGRAVVERRTVLVEDVESSPDYADYREGARSHGVRAVHSVPMLTLAGQPMGVLSTYYREPVQHGERDLELVELYARQAAEIVERARLHAQARRLAALEQRRGAQLRSLADSALALSTADTLDELLRLVTEAAVEVIGCHQGVCTRLPTGWADATTYVALSEKYTAWRDYDVVPKGLGVLEHVVRENVPLRLTPEQLVAHPDWRGLRDAPNHPPLPDYLAAPLIGRDGSNLGLVQLSHKVDETPFSAEDEAILVQLAQMASAAMERLEAFERERAARREAEQAALVRGLLSDASAAFASSLEPAELHETVVSLAVPRLGDWACLHVPDEHGGVRLAAFRHHDPVQEATLAALLAGFPVTLEHPYGPGAVLRTGGHDLFPQLPDEVLQAISSTEADLAGLRTLVGGSGLSVPLTAGGRTIGALSMSRDEPYTQRELEYAADLAQRAALALDNATCFTFVRDLAATLQRSLLPREMPVSPLLTSASRYLAGAQGTQIGGDWYDLLEVDGGELVLVVGDVMGRGVQAAAIMGQLSATVRAYALEGHSPAQVLSRLDRVVQGIEGLHFTTCIVGRLDPATRTLVLASAGHLPPLLLGPYGGAEFLELDPGLPLGVGGAVFSERTVQLDPGTTVMLYTDGLVESADSSIDEGLERLRAAALAPAQSAEEVCDRVLHLLDRHGDSADDTAILALLLSHRGPTDDVPPLVLDETASPEVASSVRQAVLGMLGTPAAEPVRDVAALLVTELVANVVRHVGGDLRIRATVQSDVLRIEVCDEAGESPEVAAQAGWEQESGRGLLLVERLADRWGTDPLPTGKRVWFELSVADAPTQPLRIPPPR